MSASPEDLIFEDIEESEVSGENGEVYLFQWLCASEKKIKSLPVDYLKSKQADIESQLVKAILAPSPYPVPGRAIRNISARCLISLYTCGETRTLFDTLQSLLKVTSDLKTPDRDAHRIAAFSCIGDLMQAFGSQYMSFMAEICTVTIKTLKSSNVPLLRYHALLALRKSVDSAKRAVTESATKDILKQMRYALVDKSLPVQRAAAEVLVSLYSGTDGQTASASDVDTMVGLSVKSMDGGDQVTRKALASLSGHMLATTQTPRTVPTHDTGKKDQDKTDEDADPVGGAAAASTETTKPLLSVSEMLTHLSIHFNKANVSRKARIGIFEIYVALFNKLGPSFVENNYAAIVSHFMTEITPQPKTRYEMLLVRTFIGIVLRDLIGVRMLSEQGQIWAIQELANSYLKRWPAMMPGRVAPTSMVLTIVLREVAGLLQQLGNAPPPVQDAIAEPLITLLAHPSHSVRINASWTLRCFCYSTPLRLPKTILAVSEMLQRDLSSIASPAAPSDINLRALGHAYGLAALVGVISVRPLYVSYDVSAKVLDMAIQLLKRSGEHDVKIAGVEVEVAWTLIASLMSLGPNFVRTHLAQLLVLWRNALPKPTTKDNNTGRSAAEWMFLLHVRECALGAILCFLQHNSGALVTLDVGRRIASLLNNALLFANNFTSQNIEDPAEHVQPGSVLRDKGLTLRAREALLRRRVYQCFRFLGFSSVADSAQAGLLQSVVSLFASPDGYAGSAVQAAIASSSGTFTSVWNSVDGYAYGVTFSEVDEKDILNRDTLEYSLDSLLRKPVLGACEHDPLSLCQIQADISAEYHLVEHPPAATAVVDSAIELFAQLLPLQDLASTTKIIMQLLESVRSTKLERNVGRRAAVLVNAAVAILLALRIATTQYFRQARDTLGNAQVADLLSSFLKDTLIDGDHALRNASSESIGRLASLAGTNFLTGQIKSLVDLVVNNRDPYARAGCALGFGAIYSHVGGLAAGPLLKTTVNVLMSLSNDSHPIVHFWALNALASVINAASLAYSPYVSGTLGMLLKIYLMGTHEREGGTPATANLGGDCPAYPILCQIIDAVISVLGPDIQESTRTRNLILNLVHEFLLEDDEGICVEAIECFQHFLMFAADHVDIPDSVNQFRAHLGSSRRPLKVASINALYQLVQRDALAMSKLGGDRLVEELFGMLDDDSSVQGVRNVISSWLQQTVLYNPSAWIDLCQRIMSKTTASQQVAEADTRDDEGESLSSGIAQEGPRGRLTSRWRTQLFALECLHQICSIIVKSGRREHLDPSFARLQNISSNGLLFSRVPDLIKMAFTASAAYVTEIRLEGLVVLRDVIQIFAKSPDPAFEDALLLEQHQAPITAALTPAFSGDSTPEILASAVHACAVFVGCGVVKDVGRMGRILKLLTAALEQSKDAGMVSLGETGELSPNASAMLRISTLSAWAQLEVASTQQPYLTNVVKPHRTILATLWIAALRDYASIRTDSEFLHESSSVAVDSSYSSLGKEVLLPYYLSSWSLILQAVAAAMASNDPSITAAMEGRDLSNGTIAASNAAREDPAPFFYVIFGIVYETLASSSSDASSGSGTRESPVITGLQTLKYLVRPEYAGKAILEPTILDEFISLSYRLAMTEGAAVQIHLLEMLAIFAGTQDRFGDDESSIDVLSPTSPRAHCLRICCHVLRHSTSSARGPIIQGDVADRIKVITTAFSAFTSVAGAINTTQREDLRSVAILLYSDLLKDETTELDLVGPTLPSLKNLLALPTSPARDSRERYSKVVHGLLSSCLLNVDEMRGRQGSISAKKVKNNLLAGVLILTVVPPSTHLGLAAIEHCCFLIVQKLLDLEQTSLTAAQCARTLVMAASSGNQTLRQCTKLLIPGLIEFIAKVSPAVSDGTVTENQSAALGEVWKAFNAFLTSVPEEQRTRALGVLLPAVCLLLPSAPTNVASISSAVSQAITQLLTYASGSPSAFREATAKLDPATRELLEQSMRRAVGIATSAPGAQNTAKPQISLRSF